MIYIYAAGLHAAERAQLTLISIQALGGTAVIIDEKEIKEKIESADGPICFVRPGTMFRSLPMAVAFDGNLAAAVSEYDIMGLGNINPNFIHDCEVAITDHWFSDSVVWIDSVALAKTNLSFEDGITVSDIVNRRLRFLVKPLPRHLNYVVNVYSSDIKVPSMGLQFDLEEYREASAVTLLSSFPDEVICNTTNLPVYAEVFDEVTELAYQVSQEYGDCVRTNLLNLAGPDYLIKKIIEVERTQRALSNLVGKLINVVQDLEKRIN